MRATQSKPPIKNAQPGNQTSIHLSHAKSPKSRKNPIISTPTSSVTSHRRQSVGTFFTDIGETDSNTFPNEELLCEDELSLQEKRNDDLIETDDFYEEDWEVPPDSEFTKEEIRKYFGKISRVKFFEQLHMLQKQKLIAGFNPSDPLSAEILSLLKNIDEERQKAEEAEARSRVKPIKYDTKIIIRTQTLNPAEQYDQMRIIQKPVNDGISSQLLSYRSDTSASGLMLYSENFSPISAQDSSVQKNHHRVSAASPARLKPLPVPPIVIDKKDDNDPLRSVSPRASNRLSPIPSKSDRKPSLKGEAEELVSNPGLESEANREAKQKVSIEIPTLDILDSPVPSLVSPKLEFVCVDYRDAYNKKVADRLQKNNSLFQYVESRQIKRDFYDDYKDEEIIEKEINLLRNHSLPAIGSSSGARRGRVPPPKRSLPKRESTKGNGKQNSEGLKGVGSEALSPRSRYIDNCIRRRLNPRAGLILRKRFTRELNLKHLGMGDQMAILLAEAIVNVPYIQSLNVRDNNLNDEGLTAIVNAIVEMEELVELDMSFNMIGPCAANALNNYLSKKRCPLKRLILQKADVDDDECRDFVSALEHNQCLEELDLSENLVGSSENLNTVMPDLTTGGEALADLLKAPTCPLKTLKLGWNLIRLDGAVSLCQSLAFNQSLVNLELSFNSLSSNGGIALGDALQDNQVLKTLNISNNSLDSIACLTIVAGIFQNEALQTVYFNENPIGEQGAKVLMLLPTVIGSRVYVMARNCNLQIKDSKNWFDSSMLIRDYHLHLDNPFDRAVAIILSHLIPAHQTYIIAHSEYFDPEQKKWIDLQLKEAVDTEYYQKKPMSTEQLKVIEGLRRILAATSDINKAVDLFKMVDTDGSGELDADEFAELIEAVGMDPSKSAEIMAEYDVDGGGVIEIAEFLLFLKTQRKESQRRLRELTEYPILYSGYHFPDNAPNKVRYVPPRTGQLKLSIIDGFTQKATYRVISPEDRTNILKVAEESGDLLTMTSFGVKNYKIRLYEALSMTSSLMKDSDKVQVLGTVLPQMAQSQEAKLLVNRIITNNITDLTRLKRLIGQFYRVIMGAPDGYYSLDLSSEMDRCCVNRLLEISMTTKHFRSVKRNSLGYGKLGDTSQKNNFSCFRNEMLNRRPVTVTTDFASPLPRAGRLEFDFVSQKRYSFDNFIINDVRFTNLLMKTFQLHKSDRTKVLKVLTHVKKQCNRTVHGNAKRIYEIPKEKAQEIGLAVEAFYLHLPERSESIDKCRKEEGVRVNWEFDPNKIQLRYNSFHRIYHVPLFSDAKYQLMMRSPQSQDQGRGKGKAIPAVKVQEDLKQEEVEDEEGWSDESSDEASDEEDGEKTASSNDEGDEVDLTEEEKMAELLRQQVPVIEKPTLGVAADAVVTLRRLEQDNSLPTTLGSADAPISPRLLAEAVATVTNPSTAVSSRQSRSRSKKQAPLSEALNRYVCLMASRNIPAQTKAVKTLELLIDTFETVSMMVRHLEIIIVLFEELGSLKTSEYFGTYRVELIIALFGNLVDVYNVELLYRHLSSFEVACLYCRLGYLNLFNPMKPEGSYSVDLSRHEERVVVKMLAHLAVVEPGDNLPYVQFRWEREMDCMPGYELTELWMTESGMPKKGIWECTYYAGEGKDLKGCKPHIRCRKGLLQLVFVEEEEILTEEDREKEKKVTPVGPSYVQANLGTFVGYLAYNEEDFKAYQDKHKGGEGDKKGGKKK